MCPNSRVRVTLLVMLRGHDNKKFHFIRKVATMVRGVTIFQMAHLWQRAGASSRGKSYGTFCKCC